MLQLRVLFPDTNILLHYPALDQIDWRAAAGASPVTLVICLQVVKELDRNKTHPALGDRARRVIKELKSWAGKEIRPDVMLEVLSDSIRSSDFPPGLSPDSDDDRIVFHLKQYLESKKVENAGIVTEDLGMELRCNANGVPVITLPTELRLPDPQSEAARRHQQTVAELDALRHRVPSLVLRISDNDSSNEDELPTFTLRRPEKLRDAEKEVNDLRAQYPPLARPSLTERERILEATNMNAIPSSEYARYNRELEEFFLRWPKAVEEANNFKESEARTFTFHLWLFNRGSAPGEDVDLSLCLPTAFLDDVADDEDKPLEHPTSPSLPERPKGAIQRQLDGMHVNIGPDARFFHTPPVAHDGVQYVEVERESDQFVIRSNVKRLKHHHHYRIGRFRVTFRSWAEVKPFQADYTITAANDPGRLVGSIPFVAKLALEPTEAK